MYIYIIYIYIYIYIYIVNWSWEQFHLDKKTFNSEHLNFPGKELNVTDITEQTFSLRRKQNRSH